MELSPRPEQLEHESAPDLLAVYADRQATVLGMTATFGELAKLCPVDLDDPNVSIEAKNNFVIKAANESGLEIAAEHEELFSQRLEALGLERKFSVEAPTKPQKQAAVTKETESQQPAAKQPKADMILATEHPVREYVAAAVEPQEAVVQRSTISGEQAERLPLAGTVDAELVAHLHQEVSTDGEESMLFQPLETVMWTADDGAQPTIIEREEAHHILNVESEATPLPVEIATELNDPGIELPLVAWLPETVQAAEHRLAGEETSSESYGQAAAVEVWEAVLHKEPAELYEDFVGALKLLNERTPATMDVDDVETGQEQSVPEIVTVITERLAELSEAEKEPVAQAMQDVIGALHGLQVMEARQADRETITAIEEQLTELCLTLFESLEIEYTEQDIKDFVAVLRNPDFRPDTAREEIVDVKDPGTHEVKYFTRMVGVAADIEHTIQSVLGTFVLRTVMVEMRHEIASVA
jgi:hypothetical protein